ncbi:MAG: hypothetical protein HY735_29350 [Verrucomicrobia bacterium]|nr:hypothetical protein [Verrucomicrobiota bacterium]
MHAKVLKHDASVESNVGANLFLRVLQALGVMSSPASGEDNSDAARPSLAVDLTCLSIEDLGQIKVTSVSRKSESLSHRRSKRGRGPCRLCEIDFALLIEHWKM